MFVIVISVSLVAFWAIICSTRSQTLRLPNNENIVFLGNSHVECAINDSIVKNSFNFARSNDYAEQVYLKLKLLKKYNPQLDTAIIGYENVLLNQNLKKPILGIISPYYYDQFTIEDISKILRFGSFKYISSHFNCPFDILKIGQILPSFINYDVNVADLKNLGRYEYLVRDKLAMHIELEKSKPMRTSNYDVLSIYFLKETINYCNENGITPIFLFPPHHKTSKIDSTRYKKYYYENYSNIVYYDFRTLELPDSCFGDKNHLNYKGAKIFSQYFERKVLHKQNYTD